MEIKPTLHKLSNGISVILDPMDVETDEVCICFKTGSLDEEESERGLTHFCEHMFFKGTPRFPSAQLARDYIADKGAYINAYTGYDKLRFCGRVVSKNLYSLLDFWADALENSLFDSNEIETERGVVLDELRRSLSYVERLQLFFINKMLYKIDVPDGTVVLGTPESIKSFTRKQIVDFIARRLSAKNCLICVSGKIDNQDELLKKIEARFNFLPTHDVKQKRIWHYHPFAGCKIMEKLNNVKLDVLFPRLWKNTIENQYKDSCIASFENVLRERLTDVLREEHGLVYGVETVYYGECFEPVNGVTTQTAPENMARVMALIAKTAHQVYTTGCPTENDLRKHRNEMQLSNANFLESNSERCNRFVFDWVNYNQMYDHKKMCELEAAVTAEDVYKYTRGYFDGPMSIIAQGPKFDGNLWQIWHDNFKSK